MAFHYLFLFLIAVSLFSYTILQEEKKNKPVFSISVRIAFDINENKDEGNIVNEKIPDILSLLGLEFKEEDLIKLISNIDADGNGKLDYNEFLKLALKFTPEDDLFTQYEEVVALFQRYETEEKHYISPSEFKEILLSHYESVTEDYLSDLTVKDLIVEIDIDGNKEIDRDELINWVFSGYN